MKHRMLVTGTLLSLIAFSTGAAFAGNQLGGGIHYLATVGDIKDSPEVDTTTSTSSRASSTPVG